MCLNKMLAFSNYTVKDRLYCKIYIFEGLRLGGGGGQGGRGGAFYATICLKVNAAPEDKLFRKKKVWTGEIHLKKIAGSKNVKRTSYRRKVF